MESNTKVTLNIGGHHFVTYATTLSQIPGTRLSNLTQDDPNYDPACNEYYFDRNPRLFPFILDAFRDGEFHFPKCICAPSILSELTFWGLTDGHISTCCWKACSDWDEEQKTLDIIEKAYGGNGGQVADIDNVGCKRESITKMVPNWRSSANTIWLFLDDPHSSKIAKVWSFFFLALLVLSTLVISLETVDSLRVPMKHDLEGVMTDSWNISNPKISKYYTSTEHPALLYINRFCSFFFFVELIIRFLSCPKKLQFFRSFFNVIDFLAVFPIFTMTIINIVNPYFWIENHMNMAYNIVGLVSILRAVRVLKIVKHSRGLQVIFLAIRASLNEMLLLGLLVAIGMVIFSTAIYYAELYVPDKFESIPVGFWWSIITITTVGYGDAVPDTPWGQIIASVCAICGILMTGLPIPVIANNFRLFYTYASLKDKLDQRNMKRASEKAPSATTVVEKTPKNCEKV